MPTLSQSLSDPDATYLVFLRRPRSPASIAAVAHKAAGVAMNSPSYGAALVDVDSLTANEAALLGKIDNVDVVLLSHGTSLNRTRLEGYSLAAVDTPLKMMDAWSKDS